MSPHSHPSPQPTGVGTRGADVNEHGVELTFLGQPCRVAVVRLRGEHDVANAPAVRAALDQALETSTVVVDLRACSFLDSSIIACLIHARRQQGGLAIVSPDDSAPARALTTCGMAQVFDWFGSLDEATALRAEREPAERRGRA